jgi:hypothetical protein
MLFGLCRRSFVESVDLTDAHKTGGPIVGPLPRKRWFDAGFGKQLSLADDGWPAVTPSVLAAFRHRSARCGTMAAVRPVSASW